MTGLRQLLFGDAPLKAMVTLGMKYGAGDLIAQQATTPGGELNCARAAVFGAFGTYYGFVNYSVFRLLAWSPVPAGAWPKAAFSAFFDGCIHVPILLYPQLLRPAQMASRQRQDWPLTARARAQSLGPLCPQCSPGSICPQCVPGSICPQCGPGACAHRPRRRFHCARPSRLYLVSELLMSGESRALREHFEVRVRVRVRVSPNPNPNPNPNPYLEVLAQRAALS